MPVETTSGHVRVRVRLSSEFQEGSFRTIDIDKGKGIKAVIGKLMGKTSTAVQSYLFDKEKWTEERAVKWVKDHGETPKANMTMETKAFPFELKETDDAEGKFWGHASIFGNVDYGGDIVEAGAFTKTIQEQQKKGKLFKVCYQHDRHKPIGLAKVEEDEKGLGFEAQLLLKTQQGRETYEMLKAKVIDEMSFAYDTIKWALPEKEEMERGIRRKLKELRLNEISPVTFAMNPEALVTDVKMIEIEREPVEITPAENINKPEWQGFDAKILLLHLGQAKQEIQKIGALFEHLRKT